MTKKLLMTLMLAAGMAVGLGLVVARGYRRTFDRPSLAPAATMTIPLVATAF